MYQPSHPFAGSMDEEDTDTVPATRTILSAAFLSSPQPLIKTEQAVTAANPAAIHLFFMFFPPKKYNYFSFFGSSKSLTWSPNKLKTSITETMTALGARATHGAF